MSTSWSGPGAALEAHLKLFDKAASEYALVFGRDHDTAAVPVRRTVGHHGASSVVIDSRQAPRFAHWLHFARGYSNPVMEISDDDVDETSTVTDGRSVAEWSPTEMESGEMSRPHIMTALAMMRTEREMLDSATTHYVSAHMVELVTQAAELAEPEPLFPTDLPCPSGIVFFERPLMMPDLHPVTGEVVAGLMPVRAMAWYQTRVGKRDRSGATDGIILFVYTTVEDYVDRYVPQIESLGVATGVPQQHFMPCVEYHPWAFGTEWVETSGIDQHLPAAGELYGSVAWERRWLLSLFRLMWQRLLRPEPWHPDRHARRRADRIRRDKIEGDYTVLHLRRFVEQSHHDRGDDEAWVHWPHPYRVPVRAHWRRQWFPSLGPAKIDGRYNPDSHRLVFIARHYRGPDHLPIKERHDVTAVVR